MAKDKKRYVIVSEKYGVLLDFTDHGTFWSRNDGQHDTSANVTSAPTFSKKKGEAEIQKLKKLSSFERDDLRLAECVADLPNYAGKPNRRASRTALANRLLLTDA
jgi:hypothetical protein